MHKNFAVSFNYLDALEDFVSIVKFEYHPTIAANQIKYDIAETRQALENLAQGLARLNDTVNTLESKRGPLNSLYVQYRNRIKTLEAALTIADVNN